MGLKAQYAALTTDASTVAADAAKEAADVATQQTDTTAFVTALGAGTAFVSDDGTTVDIVVPTVGATPPYTVTTYPVAS